jgi:hypothetical protein
VVVQNDMSFVVTLSDDSDSQSSRHDMTNDSVEEIKLHDTQNGNFILFMVIDFLSVSMKEILAPEELLKNRSKKRSITKVNKVVMTPKIFKSDEIMSANGKDIKILSIDAMLFTPIVSFKSIISPTKRNQK